MNNSPETSDVQNAVLERIRSGKLTMRPRIFFVAKTALVLFLAGLILVLTIGLVSFASFTLRLNGHESLLGFGTRGFDIFLQVFPWPLAALDLFLTVLLGWVLRQFKFAYRTSFLLLLAVLILAGAFAGVFFDRETGFHDKRYKEAEAGELMGPFESLYEGSHEDAPMDKGVYRGFVVSILSDSFVITHNDKDLDMNDGIWSVLPPSNFDMRTLHEGDMVYVAGDQHGDTITAYGVRILPR